LLALLVDPEDRVALRWWLGYDSPSARKGAFRLLRAHCERTGASPKGALDQCVAGTLQFDGVGALVKQYGELNKILDDLRPRDLSDLVDTLMPEGDEAFGVMREAALLDLPDLTSNAELLDCIRTNVTQPTMPEDVDYVRVMSLHKSKGLTSRVAIVSACTHGLIPFVKDGDIATEAAATLEEQRRLFYVAITRCTEKLVISSAVSMARKFAWTIGARVSPGRGQTATTIASQFLDELGPNAPAAKCGSDWAKGRYHV
jgi:superfamily I DNA/RNA helicase